MSEQAKVREHTFDGIQEFDNRLPNWWLWILYGSIVYAIGYWILFHTLAVVPHPVDRFAADMKAAEEARLAELAAGGVSDESLTLMASMDDIVAEGRQHFVTYCVVCHADQGQGSVGPNLTDEYWLHGGSPMDILDTVMDGVPAKGMAAWGGQLGPRRVEQAVAYVLTLRNTHVAGKGPEGEVWVPQEASGESEAGAVEGEAAEGDGEEADAATEATEAADNSETAS